MQYKTEAIPITDEAQWHALRKKCVITASNVGCLLTDHPFASIFSSYQLARGEAEDTFEGSEEMDAGTDAELMLPARVLRVDPKVKLVKAKEFYMCNELKLGGTPDFYDGDDGLWQAKCVDPAVFYKKWADGVPDYILAQHQAEYFLTGRKRGGIAVLLRDRVFTTILFPVERHDDFIATLVDEVKAFRDMVAEGKRPDPNAKHDFDVIKNTVPRPKKEMTVDLSTNNFAVSCARTLHDNKAKIKELNAEAETCQGELYKMMGEAGGIVCGDIKVSRTYVNGNEGTLITPEMVGTRINVKSGYNMMTTKEIKDDAAKSAKPAKK